MQSQSPNIIKHFLPVEFSLEVLDFKNTPKKSIAELEQNPLQNKMLKDIYNNNASHQFVLTFKNQSYSTYRPKQKISVNTLFNEINQENKKMALIKETIQEMKKSKTNLFELTKNNKFKTYSKADEEIFSARNRLSARRTEASSEKRLATAYETVRSRKSVQNLFLNMKTTFHKEDFDKSSEEKKRMKGLKIFGLKAPSSQIVDHLRRNSCDLNHHFGRRRPTK